MIAGLEIAYVCFAPGSGEVFRRTRDRDRGDVLIVVFDHDALFADVPEDADHRGRVRLIPLVGPVGPIRSPLRISPARITSSGIATARVTAAARADDDLAEPGSAGQQEKDR